jgi:hypothetical protein
MMNGKKITAFLVVVILCGCSQYDSYKGGLDSLVFANVDNRLDSLAVGIVSTDSAINKGFKQIASTITGLKEKVVKLENEVKQLRNENKKLREIINTYRNGGKPFGLLPIEESRNKNN